jgi:hypothetical protein
VAAERKIGFLQTLPAGQQLYVLFRNNSIKNNTKPCSTIMENWDSVMLFRKSALAQLGMNDPILCPLMYYSDRLSAVPYDETVHQQFSCPHVSKCIAQGDELLLQGTPYDNKNYLEAIAKYQQEVSVHHSIYQVVQQNCSSVLQHAQTMAQKLITMDYQQDQSSPTVMAIASVTPPRRTSKPPYEKKTIVAFESNASATPRSSSIPTRSSSSTPSQRPSSAESATHCRDPSRQIIPERPSSEEEKRVEDWTLLED